MKLVEDWKDVWRWYSTWIGAAIAAVPFVWIELPQDLKDYVPVGWEPYIMAGMFVFMVLGRIKDQP
jgi:hypothetical protein